MMRFRKSLRGLTVAAAMVLLAGTGACSMTVDGHPQRVGGDGARDAGRVDTSRIEGLLTECQILQPMEIAQAVGGGYAERSFVGAICRWVVSGAGVTDVTLAWFEWGDFNLEKQTAQRLGFTTENIQIKSIAAFTARDPQRPAACGVTAKSPGRGVLTWWVEPQTAPAGGACDGAIKLMEMVLSTAG